MTHNLKFIMCLFQGCFPQWGNFLFYFVDYQIEIILLQNTVSLKHDTVFKLSHIIMWIFPCFGGISPLKNKFQGWQLNNIKLLCCVKMILLEITYLIEVRLTRYLTFLNCSKNKNCHMEFFQAFLAMLFDF